MIRQLIAHSLLVLSLIGPISAVDCAHAPPNLSPEAVVAFNNTRIIKGLDLLRDTAVDGNKTVPPVISEATMLRVVTAHRSALIVVHTLGTDWKATVETSLDELLVNLPAAEATILKPYITLTKVVIDEVAP